MISTNKKNLVSAQEIIKRFQMTYPTLNHYTNLGFFDVVAKRGNQRFYCLDEVRSKLTMVEKLKNDGYPLRLITKLLKERKNG